MRVNYTFLIECFKRFNQLIFDDALPDVTLKVNSSSRTVGSFLHPRIARGSHKAFVSKCELRVSCIMDLPAEVIEDTIIHEMIHYYIWYNDITDTSVHGRHFRKIMNTINHKFARNITVSHHSTPEQHDSDLRIRNHYICITKWSDGTLGITLCSRTNIFPIYNKFSASQNVVEMRWFYSKDPWFNRFPRSRTAKAYRLKDFELEIVRTKSLKCNCDSKTFSIM